MNFTESLRTEERSGWTLNCPFCGNKILYTQLSNWDAPVPFFYSNENNDVLLRDGDIQKVREVHLRCNEFPSLSKLKTLWEEILIDAPETPSGGTFSLWSNVKCPHCKREMPYNNGVRDLNVRIYDPKVVLIDGAIIWGDEPAKSWRVKVNP